MINVYQIVCGQFACSFDHPLHAGSRTARGYQSSQLNALLHVGTNFSIDVKSKSFACISVFSLSCSHSGAGHWNLPNYCFILFTVISNTDPCISQLRLDSACSWLSMCVIMSLLIGLLEFQAHLNEKLKYHSSLGTETRTGKKSKSTISCSLSLIWSLYTYTTSLFLSLGLERKSVSIYNIINRQHRFAKTWEKWNDPAPGNQINRNSYSWFIQEVSYLLHYYILYTGVSIVSTELLYQRKRHTSRT